MTNKTIRLEIMLHLPCILTVSQGSRNINIPCWPAIPCSEVAGEQCLLEGKGSNSEPPMLTVFLRCIKLKLTKLDFCRAVLLPLFCSWCKVTKQLLFCRVMPAGEHSSHLLRPLGVSPRAFQGCSSLTCSKGGREKQQHQVQTHRRDWAEPSLFCTSCCLSTHGAQDVSMVCTVSSNTSSSRCATFSVRTAVVPFSHLYLPNLVKKWGKISLEDGADENLHLKF